MTRFYLLLLLSFPSVLLFCQHKALETTYYYPKDAKDFESKTSYRYEDVGGYMHEKFGNTTMIVATKSSFGMFYFVFKKKTKDNDDPANRDLRAFVFAEDHGGLLEKVRFQDFGNPLYWPEFDYQNCFVEDADKDGLPEFYLSYMGESDGLDAKPYKQIVYYFPRAVQNGILIKAKATAHYPAGNEEDVYRTVFDVHWKEMPQDVKNRSKKVLDDHHKYYKDKFF
ncbi:hypothetical protein [Sphingobacterium deserti]|uniref:Uncharacterized protein n=1 Tax=Sphingobacterium deserti TaxID=1229276 RepID=A0A0B8T260_9SPHI|nr:hypothetical protein [Sphingobacterium deserti]KGE12868.1 hypothetical protein DI53_3305 [Sphingobacterium deserti]